MQWTIKVKKLPEEYQRNSYKKWYCMGLGMLISPFVAWYLLLLTYKLSHAFYVRTGIDQLLKANFGDRTFNDIMIDELLVVAFDYDENEPRFFSRQFAFVIPDIYDLKLR